MRSRRAVWVLVVGVLAIACGDTESETGTSAAGGSDTGAGGDAQGGTADSTGTGGADTGGSSGVSCEADNICQLVCANDPDCAASAGTGGTGGSGAGGEATGGTGGSGGATGGAGAAGTSGSGGSAGGTAGVAGTSGSAGQSAAGGSGATGGSGGATGGTGGTGGSGGDCSAIGPSCASTPDCNGESCCTSLLVENGSFCRGPDACGGSGGYPATVSSFCMDKYEITVGRFRAFIADYDRWISVAGGSHPQPDEGEHVAGYGSGWQAAWNPGDELPADAAAFRDVLKCNSTYGTWRDTAGSPAEENLPINCISWYEAFAFCIWDGGRLPTETEWEYAAAGGDQELWYPWGSTPAPNDTLAVYDCCGDGSCGTCSNADILPVGSKPPGNGRWGHSDLAGSMWEWVFDWYVDPYPNPCDDCANTLAASDRVVRGDYWGQDGLTAAMRGVYPPPTHRWGVGARCVRTM